MPEKRRPSADLAGERTDPLFSGCYPTMYAAGRVIS